MPGDDDGKQKRGIAAAFFRIRIRGALSRRLWILCHPHPLDARTNRPFLPGNSCFCVNASL
jgi:hypothetical protein